MHSTCSSKAASGWDELLPAHRLHMHMHMAPPSHFSPPSINIKWCPTHILHTANYHHCYCYILSRSSSMALSRALLASLLLFAFAIQLVHSHTGSERSMLEYSPTPTPRIDCRPACDLRCSRSWKPKMCKKLCAICCNKCNCVPKGPSVEARAACPCYANMKNPKGQSKCP